MIAILGAQADTETVIEPEPSLLLLFHWYFKPLTSPQTFHTFVIHQPARISQQSCDPTIAIPTILAFQLNHVRHQAFLVSASTW
jgi:hypothetical protein